MAYHIKLSNGESINAAVFDRINRVDDSKLPNNRKSTSCLSAYKKHFNVEVGTVDVPVAEYSEIREFTNPSPRKFPQDYVVFNAKSKDDFDKVIEYDYDDEDSFWLQELNKERRKKKEKEIEHEVYELVMDRLEKECVFEVKAGHHGEDDDVCCICCDGETTNVNQIIYCDMCNIAVHQDCYGVPYIPSGQWLCRKCKLSPSQPVDCCLCPNNTGAFKQTADGRWAHVICAIWLNEVHFGNSVFLEPIEGVDNSLRRRAKLKCIVCRQKVGACIQCSTRSCLKAFHVTCAQNSGMSMQVCAKEDAQQEDGMDVRRFIYCHLHTDDDESVGDKSSRKKRMDNAIRNARRTMASNTGRPVNVNMPTVSRHTLDGIRNKVPIPIQDIVEYWYLKRKSRCGAPLIRRLQMHTRHPGEIEMTEEEKEVYSNIGKTRIAWESTRLLCELVKKREKQKEFHVDCCKRMVELLVTTVAMALEEAIDELCELDKHEVFRQPVKVDGYKTIVKHPMDLSTMKKRVKDGKSNTFVDLRTDFNLMMNNCHDFNTHNKNHWYLKYGKKYRKQGDEAIAKAEERYSERENILDEQINELCAIDFYESLQTLAIEEDGVKTETEDDDIKPETRARRSSMSASEKKLATPKATRNLFNSSSPSTSSSTPKRKTAAASTPINNKSKKQKVETTPRITRFFTPRGAEAVVPAPLMAYRDNSVVKSPLPADIASSESSAEEEDGRAVRRSTRLVENSKGVDSAAEDDVFRHGDLVGVDDTAGRVIDPTLASMDQELPKDLIAECRSRRRESRICVMFFETENKWGWYLPSEVKHLKMGDNKNITSPSISHAKSWYTRVINSQ